MTIEGELPKRVLLVDDDETILEVTAALLKRGRFDVVAVPNVAEALRHISTERFDALITDLHMPHPGDGFTVVSAMRHSQPDALTMIVSGHPDTQSAMEAILLQADEILVKPFELGRLAELVHEKIANRKPADRLEKERVGAILARCNTAIVSDWLERAKESDELNRLELNDKERAGHLSALINELVVRLCKPSPILKWRDEDTSVSVAAVAHGQVRHFQGYTPQMLVHESRILQVAIFGMLQKNLNYLDFSLVLPDIMTIADEVDAQLTQTMKSFIDLMVQRPSVMANSFAVAS